MRRLLTPLTALLLLVLTAPAAHAEGAISVSAVGYGTVANNHGSSCTSPASTPDNVSVGCGDFSGMDCTVTDGTDGQYSTTDMTCEASISASAPAGWQFTGWSGD